MEQTEQMPVAWSAEKPKRTLSPELKAKMKAGRQRAKEERATRKAKAIERAARPKPEPKPRETAEFAGLTPSDCCIGCTKERCAIGGSLVIKEANGSMTLVGHCTHPHKGGLSPIHMTKPEIIERYDRARRYLEHMKIDKRKS